jgi:hypothetical protein
VSNPFEDRKTPQQRGYDFEEAWADLFGSSVQKGSGNLWYAKLDVPTGQMIWSLKHTDAESFRLTGDMIDEAVEAVYGPMGKGLGTIPAWAIQVGKARRRLVVVEAADFVKLVTEGVSIRQPSKGEVKRARASMTSLERKAAELD